MANLEPDRTGALDVGAHSIHWEYFGAGQKEAVCLLNGLAMHTRAWYGVLPRLIDAYDVVLYDYPGQGQSSDEDIQCFIPELAWYLKLILDANAIDKIHVLGISYGGFVALDFARLYQERLHTLTLSGILLSHERLFELYQDISLRFYRSDRATFELYTHYMYEKIFGEPFVSQIPPDQLEAMRIRFYDRYIDHRHCLIRLTEAQNPFFGKLDENLAGYRSILTPTLVVTGEQDRAIPIWQQRKICDILPHTRHEVIPGSGHVVYLEKPDLFFPLIRSFMEAKSVDF